MTREQAIGLLAQLTANYRGTLVEHQELQEAIELASSEEMARSPVIKSAL